MLWLSWQLGHFACRKDVAPASALLLSDLGSASICDLLSLRLRCIVLSFRSIGCAQTFISSRSRRTGSNQSRSAQEINKHISDGVRAENKLKTAKTKEAKEFSKSKAEMERDGQEPYFLAEGNRYTEHERRNGSSHHDGDLNVKSLQRTMMRKRTTEQIDHVSRGNIAALVGMEQFFRNLAL